MSDTPESDKNSVEWDRANEAGCSLAFAQGIERERDELRERVAELENAIRMTIARFDQVKWGDDGDCGSAVIVGLLEWALPENKEAK